MGVGVPFQHLMRRGNHAVRPDRADCYFVTWIRSGEQETSRPVSGNIRHAVNQRAATKVLQLACFRVDGVGGDCLRFASCGGKEQALVWTDGQGSGAAGLRNAGNFHLFDKRQFTGGVVEAHHVNVVGIGIAHIDERGSGAER